MCNRCCCHVPVRRLRLTAKQWMARGYIIRQGERHVGRNQNDVAVFARFQVMPL